MAIQNAINLTATGLIAHDGAGTFSGRTITQPVAGITVTNGDGISGNPTIALDDDLAAVEGLSGTGVVTRTAANSWATNSISAHEILTGAAGNTVTGTGPLTNGQIIIGDTGNAPAAATLTAGTGISITNGPGTITIDADNNGTVTSVSGTTNRITSTGGATPVIDIDAAYVGQASITTLGTITTGTWNGTAVAVNYGGTGQTSYIDGQLLIGNSTGNTLTKASLTEPASGISITGGSGSITFALTDDLDAVESLATTGLATRTASNSWTTRTITGTSNEIEVSDGDGISGNPTIGLPSTIYADISFDSGTNTLSDYTTGTFSPTLIFGGGSTGITYSTQTGKYWRVGDIVHFHIRIILTNKGSSTGAAQITGLPFTTANDSNTLIATMACGAIATTAGSTQFFADINANSTSLTLANTGSNNISALTDVQFANNSTISITGYYWTS